VEWMIAWIVAWIALSVLAGVIAASKGRSRPGFFLLSFLLSPLIGLIAALVARPNTVKLENEQIEYGGSKRCPFCAEVIRHEAIKCRFCGSDLSHNQPTEHGVPEHKPSPTAYHLGKSIGKLFRF
jgi:hypothetical protein